MRVRSVVTVAVVATVAVGSLVPAQAAAKKKPIVKNYTVSNMLPYPSPPTGPSCSEAPEGVSEHRLPLKVTGPGKLQVTVNGFTGDWDIGVYNAAGSNLAMGGGADSPNTETAPQETLTYKSKKAQTLFVDVCNFLGSTEAKVKLVYTYL